MSLNTGFKNEREIVYHLDNHRFSDLNHNLRTFCEEIFHPTPAEKEKYYIHAKLTNNTFYKPDIIIKFTNRSKNISIKIGNGNSVHQEPIYTFIDYIKNELGASLEIINALLFFHWGDGTLDGSAPVSNRQPAKTIIKQYPEKLALVQSFFNQHLDALLERFLSTGVAKISHVDYIYYGDYKSADWHSIDDIYVYLKSNPSHIPSVGGLNFQTYGRSLSGKDDARRRDIQLKWSNMSAFFLVGNKKSIVDIESKIKGDNSHGFENVEKIINSLNSQSFENIPDSLKPFVLSIFGQKCSNNDVIKAEKVKPGYKGDMLVWLEHNKANIKNISIISGSGNSVHQENVYKFCDFLREEAQLDEDSIKSYLRYHFADGTDNNTGSITSRQSGSTYKKLHKEELNLLEQKLKLHNKVVLEHFVKTNKDYPDVDYLFYGNTELPYWAEIDSLIDAEVHKSPNPRAALAIGDFSIQAWNRSLKGGASDYKRLSMQVKWNNLLKNILSVQPKPNIKNLATQGLEFEYNFTSTLNQDKNHPLWRDLNFNDPNIILVNVSYNQISQIAGTKIRPKSDCYAIKPLENLEHLLTEKNYVLTEETLFKNHSKYKIIPSSGVSLKLPTSKNFTYQKLSYSAFNKIFTNLSPAYFIAALLYCDKAQLDKNTLILANFNTTLDSVCRALNINPSDNIIDTYTRLKNQAINTIKQIVNTNKAIYNTVCFGENIFEDPYCASFILENKKITPKENYSTKISVTTGSGRSKGIYNLAFKKST